MAPRFSSSRFPLKKFVPNILVGLTILLTAGMTATIIFLPSPVTLIVRLIMVFIVTWVFIFGLLSALAINEKGQLTLESSEITQYLDEFQDVLASRLNIHLREEDLEFIGRHMAAMLSDKPQEAVCSEWRMWITLPRDLAKGNRLGMPYFQIGSQKEAGPAIIFCQPLILNHIKHELNGGKSWSTTVGFGGQTILMLRHAVHEGSIAIAFSCVHHVSQVRLQVMRTALMQFVHYMLGLRTVIIESRRYREMDGDSYGYVVSSAVHEMGNELGTARALLSKYPTDALLMKVRQEMMQGKTEAVAKWLEFLAGSLSSMPTVLRCMDQCAQYLEWVRVCRQEGEGALSQITPEPMNIYNILDDLKESFRPAWPDNPIDISGDKELVVVGDTQLRSVFRNLLTNAAEASPEGGSIQVRIQREKKHALVRVYDEGKGVARGNEDRIFQILFTDSQGKRDGRPGSGIGLGLSRRIAQALDGNVLYAGPADPNPAEGELPGACFEVRLRIAGRALHEHSEGGE